MPIIQIPSVSWHSCCRSITVRRNPIQKGGSQPASFPALPTPGLGARLRRGGIRARDRRSCRTMSAPRAFGGLDSLPRHRGRGTRCPFARPSALDPHEDGPRAPGHVPRRRRRRGTTIKYLIGAGHKHVGFSTINLSGRVFFTQEVLGQKF